MVIQNLRGDSQTSFSEKKKKKKTTIDINNKIWAKYLPQKILQGSQGSHIFSFRFLASLTKATRLGRTSLIENRKQQHRENPLV